MADYDDVVEWDFEAEEAARVGENTRHDRAELSISREKRLSLGIDTELRPLDKKKRERQKQSARQSCPGWESSCFYTYTPIRIRT